MTFVPFLLICLAVIMVGVDMAASAPRTASAIGWVAVVLSVVALILTFVH